MASPETPFKISIPATAVSRLKQKVELATLPDELDEAGWDYGVPLASVKRLLTYWKDGYDWSKQEQQLNDELPQFTRDIEVENFGVLNIHYVHKKSEVANAIPLLFVHGWPGSFYEARKIVPLLTQSSEEHPSFHVVAISLPGYGFSEAPKKKGFDLNQYAEVGHKVMLALGYDEYVTQGGDWGGPIIWRISQNYGPTHAKAYHTNFPLDEPPHPTRRPLLVLAHLLFSYPQKDQEGLKRAEWYQKDQVGYFNQQSTKPQTLGYSLADSPVGLLTWIYEKLVAWTDEYAWTDDEVLTWISIYWFSRAGPAASVRIYYEVNKANPNIWRSAHPTSIPYGYSYFPKELFRLPRRWLKRPNLVFENEHDHGGHFAAYEEPEALSGDLKKMFGRGGPAFGVVKDKSGYDAA